MIINLITFLLSFLIPKKKGLYVFGGMRGNFFSGNTKAMFLYFFRVNNKKDIYYFVNKLFYNKFKEKYGNTKEFKNILIGHTLKSYLLLLRAEYIFIDESPSTLSYPNRLLGRFKIINLWHGDGIKDISGPAKKIKRKYNKYVIKFFKFLFSRIYILIISCSDYWKEVLKNSFLFVKQIEITGLPRNDIFFRNDLDFYDIKKNLGINNYKKIFLYAPTHRKKGDILKPFSKEFLDNLNKYLKENNYIFLINKHRSSKKIIFGNYSNIKDISEEVFDIQELLKYTDVMITDYSSIYVDYMLLDKPILFYAYDIDKYKKGSWGIIGGDYKKVVMKKGICYNENELFKLIKSSDNLFKDKEYKKQFIELKNKYHKYQNGGYIERVLEIIKKL